MTDRPPRPRRHPDHRRVQPGGRPVCGDAARRAGREVIKIEPPGGDPSRGTAAFHVLNRGKRGVVHRSFGRRGRDGLRRLVATADVLLYDWPPGTPAPVDVDALLSARAPAHRRLPAQHMVRAASTRSAAGRTAGAGRVGHRRRAVPPRRIAGVHQHADRLVRAGSSPRAQSRRRCTRASVGPRRCLRGVAGRRRLRDPDGAYVQCVRMSSAWPAAPARAAPSRRIVSLRAADDWLFAGALTPGFWASLAVAAGLEDCLVDDDSPARRSVSPIRRRAPNLRLASTRRSPRTREEWLDILEKADVPRAPVLTRDEFLVDPQVAHNKLIVNIDDPVLGAPARLARPSACARPRRPRPPPRPVLGQHQALMKTSIAAAPTPDSTRPTSASYTIDRPRRPPTPSTASPSSISPASSPAPNGSMFLADMGLT